MQARYGTQLDVARLINKVVDNTRGVTAANIIGSIGRSMVTANPWGECRDHTIVASWQNEKREKGKRNMPSVELPFWLIKERRDVINSPANEPCEQPQAAHAFTAVEKLTAFMKARGGATWHIDQIAKSEDVIENVAKLYEKGVTGICIDPEPDGSGGLLVSLSDLLAAYDR